MGLIGGIAGCLSTFAPRIRACYHHADLTPQSSSSECLSCHELESAAQMRMATQGLSQKPQTIDLQKNPKGPPLVADWMVAQPQTCAGCHQPKQVRCPPIARLHDTF